MVGGRNPLPSGVVSLHGFHRFRAVVAVCFGALRRPHHEEVVRMLRRFTMLAALLAILAPVAIAQTVDEVVAKYIQGRGGIEKIKAVKSMKATGKMIMGGGAMEAPFVQMMRRPSDSRTEFTIQGLTGIQVFDGKSGTAWSVMPFAGKKEPEAAPAEETKLMAEQADIDGPLVDWKEKGSQLELVGKEQVEGADAWKLKLTRKSGNVDYLYLDTETGLEVKSESKRTVRGLEVEGETLLSDYKEVDGLNFPFTIVTGMKGSPAEQRPKMVMDKIELNVPLADSLFTMPPTAVKPDSTKAAAVVDTAKTVKKPTVAQPAGKKK
jgi:hypothetical protein